MDNHRGSWKLTVRMSVSAVRRAARGAPLLFAGDIVANVLLALVPAAQVLAVTWLGRRMSGGDGISWAPIVATAATVCVTSLLSGLLFDVAQAQASSQHSRLLADLRDTISHFPASSLADAGTATRVQGARSAVDYTMNGMVDNVLRVLSAVVTSVSLLTALWRSSAVAAVLVVLALVPTTIAYATVAGFRRRVVHEMNRHERSQRYLTDQLVYQRTGTELAALGSSAQLARAADAESWANTRLVHRLSRRSAAGRGIAALTSLLLVTGALVALAHDTHELASAAAGILGVISGVSAVSGTGSALGQIIAAAPLMEAYADVVDDSPRVEPQPPVPTAGALTVDGLRVRYRGREEDALTDASLAVRRGEMVAFVGVNGAGKTTLVNALMGLVPVVGGRVCVDGVDLSRLSEAQRLARFGLLTQEFGRYELTVRQNMLLARPDASGTDAEIWQALRRARADGLVRDMSAGLDTHLGPQWDGVGISGGQWQRLALARIHLRDAGIWILDEPTSAIDAEAEREVFDELLRGKENRITLVVSHRASTLVRMDRIYVIDHGRIVERGTYPELLEAGGRFAQIFSEEA